MPASNVAVVLAVEGIDSSVLVQAAPAALRHQAVDTTLPRVDITEPRMVLGVSACGGWPNGCTLTAAKAVVVAAVATDTKVQPETKRFRLEAVTLNMNVSAASVLENIVTGMEMTAAAGSGERKHGAAESRTHPHSNTSPASQPPIDFRSASSKQASERAHTGRARRGVVWVETATCVEHNCIEISRHGHGYVAADNQQHKSRLRNHHLCVGVASDGNSAGGNTILSRHWSYSEAEIVR